MAQRDTYNRMLELIAKSGLEVVGTGKWYIDVKRDDSKTFGVNALCKAIEKMDGGYSYQGCKVLSRRREGRAVFEQVDHTTWTAIRFEC